MSFEVGNIVYVMHKEKNTVIPGQILEKVVRERLGKTNKISFVLEVYNSVNSSHRKITVDPESTPVYQALEDIEQVLMTNARSVINDIIHKAKTDAQTLIGHLDEEHTTKKEEPNKSVEAMENVATVELEDGTLARVRY